jgi:hypothetical protein
MSSGMNQIVHGHIATTSESLQLCGVLPKLGTIKPHSEIELRFFITAALARKITQDTQHATIEQHYFKRSTFKHLVDDLRLADVVEDVQLLTTARIRKTVGSSTYYQLELKGPKVRLPGRAVQRPEVSLRISHATFDYLLDLADGGTIIKHRHDIPGHIYFNRSVLSVVAQVDRYLMAGRPPRNLPLRFDTIDIEVPSQRYVPPLRQGKHSFGFLKKCLEIADLDQPLQDALSNRCLARDGFTKHLRKTLQALERRADKLG